MEEKSQMKKFIQTFKNRYFNKKRSMSKLSSPNLKTKNFRRKDNQIKEDDIKNRPHINAKSQRLAKKLNKLPLYKRLENEIEKRNEKLKELKNKIILNKKEDSDLEFDFKPKINHYDVKKYGFKYNLEIDQNRVLKRRKEKLEKMKFDLELQIKHNLTFSPKINIKSKQIINSSNGITQRFQLYKIKKEKSLASLKLQIIKTTLPFKPNLSVSKKSLRMLKKLSKKNTSNPILSFHSKSMKNVKNKTINIKSQNKSNNNSKQIKIKKKNKFIKETKEDSILKKNEEKNENNEKKYIDSEIKFNGINNEKMDSKMELNPKYHL